MKRKSRRILVTGGAGLIGSTIIDQLLRESPDDKVIVIDNLTRGTMLNLETALASSRVEFVEEDIRNYSRIRAFFNDVDAVFHQAAIRITQCAQEPRECLEVLIDGTFNVLQACVESNVKKVIAASSASVYGMADEFPTPERHAPYNNRTLYGVAKATNEGMLRSFHDMYGLDYVVLRYFNVYGPRMDIFGKYTEVLIRWLDCIDRHESPKIYGDGTQTMDFVFSEDVAKANLRALESDVTDDVFNVASGMETSLLELLDILLETVGRSDLQPEFLPERTVNPVPRRLADVSRAEELLGYRAQVSLAAGLSKLVAWRTDMLSRGSLEEYCGSRELAVATKETSD